MIHLEFSTIFLFFSFQFIFLRRDDDVSHTSTQRRLINTPLQKMLFFLPFDDSFAASFTLFRTDLIGRYDGVSEALPRQHKYT